MFDQIFKKKAVKPGEPDKAKDNGEDAIEAPEVDETLNDLDAALAKADQLRAAKVMEEAAEKERTLLRRLERAKRSSCGCG
jgi:hypothetical protein